MRLPFLIPLIGAAARDDCEPRTPDPAAAIAALRDTLVRIGAEDQAGRDSILGHTIWFTSDAPRSARAPASTAGPPTPRMSWSPAATTHPLQP